MMTTTMRTSFDCALFDIDGVLVDIRRSYNEAIKKTVNFVLAQSGIKDMRGLVTDRLILKFRQSGGFNNDTDTSYAIALAALLFARARQDNRIKKKTTTATAAKTAKTTMSVAGARSFLMEVAANADETGIKSVERFLSEKEKFDVSKTKEMLAYPAPVKDSYIGRVFDELFYGPALFKKQNGGLEPKYCSDTKKPLIDNDKLVVSKTTMKVLHKKFGGRLAIVSGRSRLAAEYSLEPVMPYFDIDACVFLEDERREYAKPNPYAAKRAMKAMGAKNVLYCGDSAEDMLMARRAQKETGLPITFVGIYGFSPEPAKTLKLFRESGAEAVAKNVDLLPKLLINKVKPA
ncbi:MAG TPA: HAD-IA family hydrolase [Nitrososphaera sp.]|nr:HAD-IA family hydrolase [Nitrososphaera sp.]